MSHIKIPIVQLSHAEGLELPFYATDGAAGMDLKAALTAPVTLKPMARALIETGLSIALPQDYEAQIRPRSGLAAKHGVTVLNTPGTIDCDYRGEIKVILINLGEEDFVIERGERIAQMVFAPVTKGILEITDSLSETQRGEGGFGSTGKA
ncbi:dUTP diphosphatase [Alphaproteobacteria bacterium]|nr:dUTP diphosphatase [Alphaproteobacteria bacterium]